MSGFLSDMAGELGARRRRLRESFGNRGQAIVEFLVLSGLVLGSLGLFLLPGMARAAPWGFALPPVFLVGFVLIEVRRQRALANGAAAEAVTTRSDWAMFLWAFGCALAGAAAFVIAWGARAPPPSEDWAPPRGTVNSELGGPN